MVRRAQILFYLLFQNSFKIKFLIIKTKETNFFTPTIHPVSLGKHLLFGALIGLAIISIFLLGNDYSKPEWANIG